MKIEYKTLEGPRKQGNLTIRIDNEQLAFNHTLIHKKDVYEEFVANDIGYEVVNGIKMYHVNGHILTFDEFKYITYIIRDL